MMNNEGNKLNGVMGDTLNGVMGDTLNGVMNDTINGVMMEYFEAGITYDQHLYQQILTAAKGLHYLGISALWMPPAFKGASGIRDVGYGVYDLYDLGEFDQRWTIPTKYGTKDEYISAIHCLHHHGIQVYGDIVLNHRMGSDNVNAVLAYPVDPGNRLKKIGRARTILAGTQFNYLRRNNQYSSFKWTHDHFNGVDYDLKTHQSKIYQFKDKQWSSYVSDENGNYDYLMGANVDVNQKDVRDELNRFGRWYVSFTGVDGFRLDALKHIDYKFYSQWLDYTRQQKDLFAVGEYWDGRLDKLLDYLRNMDYKLSLFDVPLHYHFFECSQNPEGYDLRRLFEGTLVSVDGMHAVTFVDNHDTVPKQALNSFVQKWFKPFSYCCILLREAGYPCVFYGDYYGLNKSRYHGIKDELETILLIRKRYAYGLQRDYFDDFNCVGWTRSQGLAVIFSKNKQDGKWMEVGKEFAGAKFYDIFRPRHTVTINNDGWAYFDCPKNKVSIFIPKY